MKYKSIILLIWFFTVQLNSSTINAYYNQFDAPPHIVVFMVDDLGWNDVGFHGSHQIPTPNIDALAYNGIILNRHYSLPSCTPTRSAFFTGKYPLKMGMQGGGIRGGEARGLPLNIKILPEYLRELGYVTRLIGKWHVGYHTARHTPVHRGFDSFLGFYNGHIGYYDYRFEQGNMSGYDMHRNDDPHYGIEGQYATDLFTAEALRIIDRHDIVRPLYLHISHLAVHAPLEVPYDVSNVEDFHHIYDPNRKKYAMTLSRLDESLGQIVSSLGERGMLNNTFILFLSDNGAAPIGKHRNYGSNWPLRGTKYTLFEGGVRTVAAIWSSRLREIARVSNQLVHVTDWLPTLYVAAGGDIKDLGDVDGVNQLEVLNAGRGHARDKILLNIDEITRTKAAIHGRFKLLQGSLYNGYYDGIEGDSGKNHKIPTFNSTKILKSAVSMSIQEHLGEPVTQPSTMFTLRLQATVQCRPNSTLLDRYNLASCNSTGCLFDIVNDPCETVNIARSYPRITTELELYLQKYENVLLRQMRVPIDWLADPRRNNYTWQPWLPYDAIYDYYPNAGTSIQVLAILAHIVLLFLIIFLKGFM